MALSEQQRHAFAELGFTVLRQVLAPRELAVLRLESAAAIGDVYGGDGHGGFARDPGPAMGPSRWAPLMSPGVCPLASSLLDDSRFHGACAELFADQPTFFPGAPIGQNCGTLWTSGSTGWHRDIDVLGSAGVNTGIGFIFCE